MLELWRADPGLFGLGQGYLTDAYKSLGKPIWLTEFAGAGTVAEQQTFFQDVIPWMESQVRGTRISYLTERPDSVLTFPSGLYGAVCRLRGFCRNIRQCRRELDATRGDLFAYGLRTNKGKPL